MQTAKEVTCSAKSSKNVEQNFWEEKEIKTDHPVI